VKTITSAANEAYRRWLRLAHSTRAVRTEGRTIAEGVHLAAELAAARVPIEAVLARRGATQVEAQRWIDTFATAGAPAYELAAPLFDRLSPVVHSAGIAVVFAVPKGTPAAEGDCLLLDGVQDPGNVGALLRVAAAAGVRSVFTTPGTATLWAPKVLRGAQGAHFRLALVEDVQPARVRALFAGPWIGAVAHQAVSLWTADLRAPRVGWIVGAEGAGLSPATAALCDLRLAIPLAAGVESLNVAAAAAVCLFERRRQLLAR
jgi:TrmH family RNA methyltransferase